MTLPTPHVTRPQAEKPDLEPTLHYRYIRLCHFEGFLLPTWSSGNWTRQDKTSSQVKTGQSGSCLAASSAAWTLSREWIGQRSALQLTQAINTLLMLELLTTIY